MNVLGAIFTAGNNFLVGCGMKSRFTGGTHGGTLSDSVQLFPGVVSRGQNVLESSKRVSRSFLADTTANEQAVVESEREIRDIFMVAPKVAP